MTILTSPAEQIAVVIKRQLARTVRSVYEAAEEGAGMHRVAVALSGGVDSCSILSECLSQGYRPLVISYTPHTHESTDFKMARQTAKNMRLGFLGVQLDMRPHNLESLARSVISMGYMHKVGVECLAPLWEIIRCAEGAGVGYLFTGDQSDGYFALSRFAGLSHDARAGIPVDERVQTTRDDPDSSRIDEIRQHYWDVDQSCSNGVKLIGHNFGIRVAVPYRDKKILQAFLGKTWREVNKPKQKMPIRLAYSGWFRKDGVWVRGTAVNLHKGDSGFGDTFGQTLLEQFPGYGSPAALYRAMARGEV